ncbi:MAG: hypothetical protein ACREBV_06985, partial [Candidatus Zixiibacteriota bacterium]
HMERERILVISHSYTPFLNPRAFRWSAIAEHWVKEGTKVDVVSSWLPGLKRFEILNGVEIHRVGGTILERLRAMLRPKTRATAEIDTNSDKDTTIGYFSTIGKWVFAAARFINDKIWKNIYWPDYACTWIGPAASKAIELCEMEKYSAVVSVSDPFSSHLAGEKVKQFKSEINWLVDIGDPFSFRHDNPTNNHTIYRKLNNRVEKRIFSFADCVTVTSENTRRKYAEVFGGLESKIHTVHPLWDKFNAGVNDDRILSGKKKIKLVYVGTLYRSIRNPEYLLKLFEILASIPGHENVELHFFGGNDDCRSIFETYHYLFGEKLFFHGLVSRTKVLRAMSEADILVNIGNNNPYQLPSKLVEYAGLAKPILNLYTIANDSSKEFLQEYPAILNIQASSSAPIYDQANQLAEYINLLPMEIPESFRTQWLSRFSVETIAGEYSRLLKPIQSGVTSRV